MGTPGTWVDWATVVGGFATGLGLFALVIAWTQIRAARKTQRENAASQAYDALLLLYMQYPTLTEPNKYGTPRERKDDQSLDEQFTRYEWFVSKMLATFDMMLGDHDRWRNWVSTIEAQLVSHAEYLRTANWLRERARDRYRKRLCDLLEKHTGPLKRR